jgi:hypothetical protein
MAQEPSDDLFSPDFHRWLKEDIVRQDELLMTKRTIETSCGRLNILS